MSTKNPDIIDPLIAKTHDDINRQLAVDAGDASDDAWENPEKIMGVGVDEFTAHSIARSSGSLSPEHPCNISDLSEIIPPADTKEIRTLEALAKDAADKSRLFKGYDPVGITGTPFTRGQIHQEITGEKPVTSSSPVSAGVYDQEREAGHTQSGTAA